MRGLLDAKFISEIKYPEWISNMVLVKKASGKWMMCVDYTNLNPACLKVSYPLPSINQLVDNSASYQLLSFMDAYFGYNQIPMSGPDLLKNKFMTE